MMVDPAVGVRPTVSGTYDPGSAAGVWMKEPNGTDHLGSKSNCSPQANMHAHIP